MIGAEFTPVEASIVAVPLPRSEVKVPVPLVILHGPLAPCTCSRSPWKLAVKVPLPSAHVKTRLPAPLPSQLPEGQSGGGGGDDPPGDPGATGGGAAGRGGP